MLRGLNGTYQWRERTIRFVCVGANAGTILTGFNIGGTNTLQAIINNTNTGITGNLPSTFAAGGGTLFGVTGSGYFSQMPEPATAAFSSAGLLLIAALRSRRSRG